MAVVLAPGQGWRSTADGTTAAKVYSVGAEPMAVVGDPVPGRQGRLISKVVSDLSCVRVNRNVQYSETRSFASNNACNNCAEIRPAKLCSCVSSS